MGRSDYLEILDEAEALEKCVHRPVVPSPVHSGPRVFARRWTLEPRSGPPPLAPFAIGRAEIARLSADSSPLPLPDGAGAATCGTSTPRPSA